MITPQFPFKDNQIILSSNRIILHSKNDAIFLFGKGAVSLSSPNTINLDANEKVVVYSPKIELGNSPAFMEPTIKGRTFLLQLGVFFERLEKFSDDLSTIFAGIPPKGSEDLAASITTIRFAGIGLKLEAQRLKNLCSALDSENAVLAKNTYVS